MWPYASPVPGKNGQGVPSPRPRGSGSGGGTGSGGSTGRAVVVAHRVVRGHRCGQGADSQPLNSSWLTLPCSVTSSQCCSAPGSPGRGPSRPVFHRLGAYSAMQVPAERPQREYPDVRGPRSRPAARPAAGSTGITPLPAGPPPRDSRRMQMVRYTRTGSRAGRGRPGGELAAIAAAGQDGGDDL
jgi:hypothetical protein